ncbi:MAG: glycoside hydrolase family 31 protein, partial [Clostridia bacterium]|nr:glycoside hydrolase family 31 protein [Clostridia bacterium]
EFFVTPQYNTWIELMYEQNQEDILRYAKDIIKNGFEPGVLIIDEGWHEPYGNWTFHTGKFSNPTAMVDELHRLGFKVMLWIVPFVSPDSRAYRELRDDPENVHLVRLKNGRPALFSWWNGYSFALDMTKQCDYDYLDKRLTDLMTQYKVDGFKFDGGNIDSYASCTNGEMTDDSTAAEKNIAWNDFGRKFAFHEFKDTYNCGGKCIVQRLRDKHHTWGENGLAELIPGGILQGLLGYPYICPDMIGGGDFVSFIDRNFNFDEELYVRMAQCSTFFPMMQFSKLPWCALSNQSKEIVADLSRLHTKFSDYIYAQVEHAAKTGEPIIRSMEFEYPGFGYETVTNQFIVGDKLLVAPMLEKGVCKRTVEIPSGVWTDEQGAEYTGPCTAEIDVPIERLPYFIKK